MQTKQRKPKTVNAHQIRQGWAEKYFGKGKDPNVNHANYAKVPSYDASYYRNKSITDNALTSPYSIKEWRAVKWLRRMVSRIRRINRN